MQNAKDGINKNLSPNVAVILTKTFDTIEIVIRKNRIEKLKRFLFFRLIIEKTKRPAKINIEKITIGDEKF